jgi:hypothetical protein
LKPVALAPKRIAFRDQGLKLAALSLDFNLKLIAPPG